MTCSPPPGPALIRQNRLNLAAIKGCRLSHGSQGGSVVQGNAAWHEDTTLCGEATGTHWGEGSTQGTHTGTFTQISTGTCLQTCRGTQTFFVSQTWRVTFTGQQIVLHTGT